ncbi:hypothetical protein DFJ74DRAFT_644731 [Hyaloraphidium curvatum]|nr:hypothetical protein DFJ74DRAFT_644731 [Hyaloraphidium curvatum]
MSLRISVPLRVPAPPAPPGRPLVTPELALVTLLASAGFAWWRWCELQAWLVERAEPFAGSAGNAEKMAGKYVFVEGIAASISKKAEEKPLLVFQKLVDRHFWTWDSAKRAWAKGVLRISDILNYPASAPEGVMDICVPASEGGTDAAAAAKDLLPAVRVPASHPPSPADFQPALPLLNQEFVTAPTTGRDLTLWEDELAPGLLRIVEREIGVSGVERGLRAGEKVVGFGELKPANPVPYLLPPTIDTPAGASPPFPFYLLPRSWRTLPSLFLVAQSHDEYLSEARTRARRWKALFFVILAFAGVGVLLPRLSRRADSGTGTEDGPAEGPATAVAESEKCAVCLDRRPEVILAPCMHYCLCAGCAERVDACPICRKQVGRRIKTFRAAADVGEGGGGGGAGAEQS